MDRLDRDVARVPVIRTPSAVLKRLGRFVLWLLAVVLLLRGLAGVLAPREPAAVVGAPRPAPAAWPDDEARAFAADFARAYLSYSPRDPQAPARAVQAFAAPELASSIVPELADDAPRRSAGSVTVARTARLDRRHALVTVAADVAGETRYLTVPVARDGGGGLVVSDLPAFAAPPARGSVEAASSEPLPGPERAPIEDVLSRFLRAYLAGDARELEYLVPAGARVSALGQRNQLLGIVSLSLAAPPAGREREVLATVRARDVATDAVYSLRYRVRLVRGDRWYVAAVNTTPRGG